MRNKVFLYTALVFCGTYCFSQIGIGTNNPSTTFHVKESKLINNTNNPDKADGILIPKLTKAELALKQTTTYQIPDQLGALVYVTDVAGNISGPSLSKVINITSAGFYFLNELNIWEPITGNNMDASNDSWSNNSAQTRVELSTNSYGEARVANSQFVITDEGKVGINVLTPTKRLEINAANGANTTDYIKLEKLSTAPENTVTKPLQIDNDGFISQRDEENIEGKILRIPLARINNILPQQTVALSIEDPSYNSPNLTLNYFNLIPGFERNSATEFSFPPGLYKYEIRLIGFFNLENPKNSVSLSTFINGEKYSTHFYGSNSRAGYSGSNTTNYNQHYTNFIKSDFIEFTQNSRVKFEITNYTNQFTVVNYASISGTRSYRSVILFQRIK